jgi:hypothetical protein
MEINANIEIDEEALRSLPEGESVHDQFVSRNGS